MRVSCLVWAALLAAVSVLPGSAIAEVYRCPDGHGGILLTNVPSDPSCHLLGAPPPNRSRARERARERDRDRTPPSSLEALIASAAAEYGLEPELVKAVVHVESGFDPRAVSPAGAEGLMQIMPRTARDLGLRHPFDPRENLRAGARHLKRLMRAVDGDLSLTLAAYNAGLRAVQSRGGIPPFPETQRYVRRVLNLYRSYIERRRADASPALAGG